MEENIMEINAQNVLEEQKKAWCIDFFNYVKNLIVNGIGYQFYSEELLANFACNIVTKNKELSESGCPSFAFDLRYDPEKQIIHFNARGVVYEDNDKVEIPLESWVSRETLEEIYNIIYK